MDLRHPLDFEADPRTLPGAIRMAPDEVARQIQEIPRDRDVVLYCTCPNEATSARVALLLRRGGILRVRPLAGGFSGWVGRDYPTDSRARIVETSSRLSSVRNKIAPT
ncbi:MAG: rhodanese-like domain-containing protein [Candidatus Acidiferrales bacterium]